MTAGPNRNVVSLVVSILSPVQQVVSCISIMVICLDNYVAPLTKERYIAFHKLSACWYPSLWIDSP